jgi:hypothetical protein
MMMMYDVDGVVSPIKPPSVPVTARQMHPSFQQLCLWRLSFPRLLCAYSTKPPEAIIANQCRTWPISSFEMAPADGTSESEERENAYSEIQRLTHALQNLVARFQYFEANRNAADERFRSIWNARSTRWKRSDEGIQYRANALYEIERYGFEMDSLRNDISAVRIELQSLVLVWT